MSRLTVTLIDVGWGDSILIESVDSHGIKQFALVDSNDNAEMRSSYIFLRRYFEKMGRKVKAQNKPFFEFVMLSHSHTDHGRGLKAIMQKFGTRNFLYPRFHDPGICAELLRFSARSTNVGHFQSVDDTDAIALGDAVITFLWPRHGDPPLTDTENNNSVVMRLRLGNDSLILNGDAEKKVWRQIQGNIPADTKFFKVPHHGSVNGTFDGQNPAWLNGCPSEAWLGISSHVTPHPHPHQKVIDLFKNNNRSYLRTDESYHLSFYTEGNGITPVYSH